MVLVATRMASVALLVKTLFVQTPLYYTILYYTIV